MRDDPAGHAAVDIALTLLQAGARAMIAGDGGPLVGELRAFGGEWLPMINDTLNPLRIRANARTLAQLIAGERIDIVHAQSAGGAWSALAATHKQPVFLVTSFPDRLPAQSYFGNMLRASLARGDRVIAPSTYVSHAMIDRYRLPADRITVIPRAIDTDVFSPAAVRPERIAALRRAWAVLPEMRIVLVPGRIAPWNGQMSVIDAARLLVGGGGERNIVFVFAGEELQASALCAQRAHAGAHARRRHAVPFHRPLPRHAGRARGRRRRGGARARAAAVGPRGGRGAGHGPAGDRHRRRDAAGKPAVPAAHAR